MTDEEGYENGTVNVREMLAEEIDEMKARIAELEAKNDRLKIEHLKQMYRMAELEEMVNGEWGSNAEIDAENRERFETAAHGLHAAGLRYSVADYWQSAKNVTKCYCEICPVEPLT